MDSRGGEYSHLRCVEVLLALDVEFAVGAALKLKSNDNAGILGNDVPNDGQVGSERLYRFEESVNARRVRRKGTSDVKIWLLHSMRLRDRLTACWSVDRKLYKQNHKHEHRTSVVAEEGIHPSQLLTGEVSISQGN